jgi:Flagellar biosynthesis protein, FliO
LGVFAHALSLALEQRGRTSAIAQQVRPGLAAWLGALLRRRAHREPRLALVERISLAPRQIVALVEADGQRLLIATSPEGAPVFFPLNPAIPDSTTTQESQADAEGTSL